MIEKFQLKGGIDEVNSGYMICEHKFVYIQVGDMTIWRRKNV